MKIVAICLMIMCVILASYCVCLLVAINKRADNIAKTIIATREKINEALNHSNDDSE